MKNEVFNATKQEYKVRYEEKIWVQISKQSKAKKKLTKIKQKPETEMYYSAIYCSKILFQETLERISSN